ncbi:MAG: hypothetical protein ABWY66_11145 [Xanthobacteraceae bacterium]
MAQALGAAVISRWAELPQPIQEKLFEAAIVLGHQSERDENLREQLAKFLHDHHKRTAPEETRNDGAAS